MIEKDPDGIPPRDPLADLLRGEAPEKTGDESRWMRAGFRPSTPKIAAAACVLVAVVAAGVLGVTRPWQGDGEQTTAQGTRIAGTEAEGIGIETTDPGPTVVPWEVVRIQGEARLVRAGGPKALDAGDEVRAGDVIGTGAGSGIGLVHPSGAVIAMGEHASVVVSRHDADGLTLKLGRGTIALVADAESTVVETGDVRVAASGAVLTARSDRGHLVRVAVARGEVEAVRESDDATLAVRAGEALDAREWTVAEGAPDPEALRLLAIITDDVGAPATEEEAGAPAETAGETDASTGVKVEETTPETVPEADRLMQEAGDHRKAGEWAEAAEAYLAAAEAGSGKQAEKAYLRAAEIQLRKLGDSGAAAGTMDRYLSRFPSGAHLDEALFLAGMIHLERGEDDEALGFFRRYLDAFPGGPQVARVHLTMAKILAWRKGDCASAMPHAQAVIDGNAGGKLVEQAQEITGGCGGAAGQ